MQIGRNPEEFLNKGIRLHCDKVIDRNVYTGFTKVTSTGLCNNPSVLRASADPHTAGGTDTQWHWKTADEILNDINQAISALWRDNDCSSDALPNHILVPVQQFGALVTRKVSDDSERSILTYVLENNIARQQGVDLVISPCKWCSGIGSNGSDRMVVYCNQVDRICFNLTQPLRRMQEEYADMRLTDIRILSRRDSALRRSLASDEKGADEISATGGRQCLSLARCGIWTGFNRNDPSAMAEGSPFSFMNN